MTEPICWFNEEYLSLSVGLDHIWNVYLLFPQYFMQAKSGSEAVRNGRVTAILNPILPSVTLFESRTILPLRESATFRGEMNTYQATIRFS